MKIILNILTLFFSVLFIIIALNVLVLLNLLNIFDQKNLPRHWALNSDRFFLTFYPNTHDKTLKNYTAILGDSIAVGEGDGWVNDNHKYSIAHYLRDIDGENYLNFGKPGANSITSIKEFIFTFKKMKKSIFLPKIEEPKKIIIFFESGDLVGNYQYYKDFGNSKKIKQFVTDEISNLSNYNHRIFNINFPFIKSSFQVLREKAIHYIYLGIVRKILIKYDLKEDKVLIKKKKFKLKNEFIIGEKSFFYNDALKDPNVTLRDKEKYIGLQILYESVRYLKNKYPNTIITIINVPQASSIYDWKYPITFEEDLLNRKVLVQNSAHLKKTGLISDKIKFFAKGENIGYINTVSELSKIAKYEYIHGKRDLTHYNLKGYEYIANIISLK